MTHDPHLGCKNVDFSWLDLDLDLCVFYILCSYSSILQHLRVLWYQLRSLLDVAPSQWCVAGEVLRGGEGRGKTPPVPRGLMSSKEPTWFLLSKGKLRGHDRSTGYDIKVTSFSVVLDKNRFARNVLKIAIVHIIGNRRIRLPIGLLSAVPHFWKILDHWKQNEKENWHILLFPTVKKKTVRSVLEECVSVKF